MISQSFLITVLGMGGVFFFLFLLICCMHLLEGLVPVRTNNMREKIALAIAVARRNSIKKQ